MELLYFNCRLTRHNIPARDEKVLMRGMPILKEERPCGSLGTDVGPQAQVDAIRRRMAEPLVPTVAVSGNYALADWYGAGGGEKVLRLSEGRWRVIAGGGGGHNVDELRSLGIPESALCAFRVYGARCSHQR